MILAFYKVDNSKQYDRHTFDNIYDKQEKILEMLRKLGDDEWISYDMSTKSSSSKSLNASDFENDYNDEYLDGGWWCIIF